MTVQHKDLTGPDLHGSKVTIAALTTAPTYLGELRFHGGLLYVGTSLVADGWTVCGSPPPISFRWSLATAGYVPASGSVSKVTLYYFSGSAIDAAGNPQGFELVHSFTAGIDWNPGNPIDLTPFLQLKGVGSYTCLLSGLDAYGLDDRAKPGQQLSIQYAEPLAAVQLFDFSVAFIGLENQEYLSVKGVEILDLMGVVTLSIDQV